MNVLDDPSCSISYFLLIFSLDYSVPTSSQSEFKVTSALSRLLGAMQIQPKSFLKMKYSVIKRCGIFKTH